MHSVSIIVPVYNQPEVTKQCLESLLAYTYQGCEILVIDNASDSPTQSYLKTLPVRLITNDVNRGCAGAWNQGVRLSSHEYICIVNNDIVVTPGWLGALMDFFQSHHYSMISPAMREGELNYDLDQFSRQFQNLWGHVTLRGEFYGVCFLAHRTLYQDVGLFDENFRFGKFEDEDFYFRMRNQKKEAAVTCTAFIHHFGSRTIQTLKKTRGDFEEDNRKYFQKKWKKLYLWRKLRKWRLLGHHKHVTGLINRTRAFIAGSK